MNNNLKNKLMEILISKDLEVIKYNSQNKFYKSNVNKFGLTVFIKINTSNKRFLVEKNFYLNANYNVNKPLEIISELNCIILPYLNYKELKYNQLIKSGYLLADFHKQKIYNSAPEYDIFLDLESKINKIKASNATLSIYNFFISHKDLLKKEYDSINKVIVHSDFGYRNLKILNKKIIIIDFERVKKGIAYSDLIKLFLFGDISEEDHDLYLDSYRENKDLITPSSKLIFMLYFIEGLGMELYCKKNSEPKLEKIYRNIYKKINNMIYSEHKKVRRIDKDPFNY